MILIFFSAFFSAAETAYSSLNPIRLKVLEDDGDKRATKTLKLHEKYADLLSSILIGNNIVNITATAIATALCVQKFGDSGTAIATIVLTLIILIFGEISPKLIAKAKPEQFAMSICPIMQVFVIILFPLNFLFALWKKFLAKVFHLDTDDPITEEEIVVMLDEAKDDGTFDEDESNLIKAAIEFDDVDVGSILTHRTDVVAVEDTVSMKELYDVFVKNSFSRIPVFHETIDNIIGMILEKDFFPAFIDGKTEVKELITDVDYTTDKAKVSELLTQFQGSQNHMAVVIDEFGGTQGIITLEDVIESLVGEIWDEHDDIEEPCYQQADGTWIVHGTMPMEDFIEKFDLDKKEDSTITVGGWVLSKVGHIPEEGYSFTFENIEIDVVKVIRRRITQLRVTEITEPEED